MNTDQKIVALKVLGSSRKEKCYAGYRRISDFHDGRYESEFVSPYTNTAGSVDSRIAILLQDWSSEEGLSGPFDKETARLGYTPCLPTNRNLVELLRGTFGLELSEVFVTNVFPYVKPGRMSASVPQRILDEAFVEFCLPQIEIVQPKLLVCSGKKVFLSVKRHFDNRTSNELRVHNYFQNNGFIYYYQRHPSPLAINRNGGIKQAKDDWMQMKKKCCADFSSAENCG